MEDPNQSVNNEETEFTRLTPPSRYDHIVLRVEDCIVVTGGFATCTCRMFHCTCKLTRLPMNEVWVYNLYTDQWSKYLTPPGNETPTNVKYEPGVVIGGDIYLLCRGKSNEEYTHTLWILRNPLDKSSVCWEKVSRESQEQQPSPRDSFGCWAYGGKLWIFGGEALDHNGDPTDVYNNDLISFDPVTKTWRNQQCSGNIPSPRADVGSGIIDNKVWLFGGRTASDYDCDYLYTLHMESEPFIWTRTLTGNPSGLRLYNSTFTVNDNSLVLNGITQKKVGFLQETWSIDLTSYTWRLHSVCDEMRDRHVSCEGLNNATIVLGGRTYKGYGNNSTGYKSLFHVEGNFLRHIMPQPKSLEQLALKAVYTHRNILPWKDPRELPQHLITRLQELLD